MKVGFDIHGCIDLYPEQFKTLSEQLISGGHEVHIITGQEWCNVKNKVEQAGISFTHHFSIVDYHKTVNTKMWQDTRGTWWMDQEVWVRSKGNYIYRWELDIHFDDSYEYAQFVPSTCTFILVPKRGFVTMFNWLQK